MNCPSCGSKIPGDSEYCQKCGTKIENKKEQNISKILVVIASVITVLSIITCICIYIIENKELTTKQNELDILQDGYNKLDQKYTSKCKDYDNLESKYDELKTENLELYNKANVLDNYIVFVGSDEYYYHKYDCSHLNMSEFWAFNEDAVIGRYYPCPYCIN